MSEPMFLRPVFHERIWGGTRLREAFGYEIPSDHTGECWGISAHPHGKSIVDNGKYAGFDLSELWQNHRYLFGHAQGDVFPLLTKILDCDQDLSIQVHPDDAFARSVENEAAGKTECWYIIDCDPGAEIVYGHTVNSKEEFQQKCRQREWGTLFQRFPIQPGDFFYVPSGTVHALCKGTLVLETQQTSDITYRVYDYDRVDERGQKRELHLEKAVEVIRFPHQNHWVTPSTHVDQSTRITTYIENEFFTVQKWQTQGRSWLVQDRNFLLISVLRGQGKLTTKDGVYPFFKGHHLILPHGLGHFQIEGKTEWIVSFV